MTIARRTAEDRTIRLDVEDAPDMPVRFTKMTISPRELKITYRWTAQDGLYHIRVEASGPRRLKSEKLSEFWNADDGMGERDWPEWMATLVAEHTPDFTR